MTEEDLIDELTRAGIHVAHVPARRPGAWYRRERLIVIDSGLTPVTRKCVLAHEAAHAYRGDDGPQPAHIEAMCDRLAAGWLISPAEYRIAEQIVGAAPWALAQELGVTPGIIAAFQCRLKAIHLAPHIPGAAGL